MDHAEIGHVTDYLYRHLLWKIKVLRADLDYYQVTISRVGKIIVQDVIGIILTVFIY